jgi:hypothetical protein
VDRAFARAVAAAYRDVFVRHVIDRVWEVLLTWVGNPPSLNAQAVSLRLDPANLRRWREQHELPFRTLVTVMVNNRKDFIDVRTKPPTMRDGKDDRGGCVLAPGIVNDLRYRAAAAALNTGYERLRKRPPDPPLTETSVEALLFHEDEKRPLPKDWDDVYWAVVNVLVDNVGYEL